MNVDSGPVRAAATTVWMAMIRTILYQVLLWLIVPMVDVGGNERAPVRGEQIIVRLETFAQGNALMVRRADLIMSNTITPLSMGGYRLSTCCC